MELQKLQPATSATHVSETPQCSRCKWTTKLLVVDKHSLHSRIYAHVIVVCSQLSYAPPWYLPSTKGEHKTVVSRLMSWSTTLNLQKLADTCNYGACIYYNTSNLSIVAMLMNKAIIAFPVHYSVYYTVCKLTNCVSCYSTDYL